MRDGYFAVGLSSHREEGCLSRIAPFTRSVDGLSKVEDKSSCARVSDVSLQESWLLRSQCVSK